MSEDECQMVLQQLVTDGLITAARSDGTVSL